MLRARTTYRRRTGLRLLVGPVLALLAVAGLPFAPLGPVPSAVAADYRSTVLEDSPKSYWRLGAGGAGHDQTGLLPLNSTATSPGQAGAIGGDPDTAVYFNGSNSSLNRTSLGSPHPLGFGHFSLEAWFKADVGWHGEGYLVHVGSGWYRLGVKEGRLVARATVAGGSATVTSGAYVADGEWHHAVVTGDGARLRLYLDSVEVGNVAMGGPAVGSISRNVSIGLSLGLTGSHFKGSIDEAAVYDTPLSPERIAAHYVASGRQPRLVGGPMADYERRGECNRCEGQAAASFGQATHFPVNTATGNFWHTFTDLAIPGRGVPLRLERTYNSDMAAVDGPFGKGWSSTYAMALSVSPGQVTFTQENGSEVVFTVAGAGYAAPPRVRATLSKAPDGSYTVVRNGTETFLFGPDGALVALKDLHGQTTSVSRPDASTMVVT
ncbi:MAG: LamG-like jellyroll fold domain-containing protein, partial [Actinomycetota bacterium]